MNPKPPQEIEAHKQKYRSHFVPEFRLPGKRVSDPRAAETEREIRGEIFESVPVGQQLQQKRQNDCRQDCRGQSAEEQYGKCRRQRAEKPDESARGRKQHRLRFRIVRIQLADQKNIERCRKLIP